MTCDTCKGNGIFVYFDDPSPSGISLSPGRMMEYEACPDCIGHGRCPSCGKDNNDIWPDPIQNDAATGEEYEHIPCECGWNFEEQIVLCEAAAY